jgi:hypothetical protein
MFYQCRRLLSLRSNFVDFCRFDQFSSTFVISINFRRLLSIRSVFVDFCCFDELARHGFIQRCRSHLGTYFLWNICSASQLENASTLFGKLISRIFSAKIFQQLLPSFSLSVSFPTYSVTSLGEFSPIGRLFTRGNFLNDWSSTNF